MGDSGPGAPGFGGPAGPGGPGSGPGGWLWVPGNVLKKPWRKRHPVLFWGFALLVVFGLVSYGLQWAREDGPLGQPKIAVINVEGVILDADAVVRWIEQVRTNPRVSGAVVRVNSPGGAVGPSQEMYRAVKRLSAEKPTVVSMGAVAASGGYYVALGGREIFAGPSTLTASIGVKMQIPNMEKLMGTIGISEKTLATGALKDAGSSWREMRPEEETYLKALMDDMYEAFLAAIAESRKMPLEKLRPLADGRAMTGRQALAAGLVDTLGDKQDAIERVRVQCGLPSPPVVVEGPEKPVSLFREMMGAILSLEAEHRANSQLPQFIY
jgi:protease-4